MSPQFNNMNELTGYLEAMENRVKTLEGQNASLSHALTELGGDDKEALPKTNLLSRKFLARAFTVWGHYFVAQLLISLAVACIFLVIGLLIPGLITTVTNLVKGIPTP
jgi:hypothetical protein